MRNKSQPRAFVRHAELMCVHAHAGDTGNGEVEGRHAVAQLPRERQHKATKARIRVAGYPGTAGNLPGQADALSPPKKAHDAEAASMRQSGQMSRLQNEVLDWC